MFNTRPTASTISYERIISHKNTQVNNYLFFLTLSNKIQQIFKNMLVIHLLNIISTSDIITIQFEVLGQYTLNFATKSSNILYGNLAHHTNIQRGVTH